MPFSVIPKTLKSSNRFSSKTNSSKIGEKYSWYDCIKAAFGFKPRNDDKWQCAEFANAVIRMDGIELDQTAITPGSLVKEVLKKGSGRSIYIDKLR